MKTVKTLIVFSLVTSAVLSGCNSLTQSTTSSRDADDLAISSTAKISSSHGPSNQAPASASASTSVPTSASVPTATLAPSPIPTATKASVAAGVTSIAVGDLHACAVNNGALVCWGVRMGYQLGSGSLPGPCTTGPLCYSYIGLVNVPGFQSGVTATIAASSYSCAVKNNRVFCWGSNGSCQFGVPGCAVYIGNGGNMTPQPVAMQGLPAGTITGITGGTDNICVVINGEVWCTGSNNSGQLGNGSPTTMGYMFNYSNVPVKVSGLTNVKAVSAGDWHACAVTEAGEVFCWGFNSAGQLGNGTTTLSLVPVKVVAGGATAVSAGAKHTCAIVNDRVFCWGSNHLSQLGAISQDSCGPDAARMRDCSKTPIEVRGLPIHPLSISAGSGRSCAQFGNGVFCWGQAPLSYKATPNPTRIPTAVPGLESGVTQMVMSSRTMAGLCAIVNGKVQCMGGSYLFGLGKQNMSWQSLQPWGDIYTFTSGNPIQPTSTMSLAWPFL